MRRATLIWCLFMGACAEGPPTRGVPVTFEGVCGKANEGKRVMLEGYMEFPDSFGASEPTIMMRVRPSLESWQNVVGAGTRLGNGANSVELPPKTFKRSDMKLHLADGQVMGYGNKVKVSGTMYYPSAIAHVSSSAGSQTLCLSEANNRAIGTRHVDATSNGHGTSG